MRARTQNGYVKSLGEYQGQEAYYEKAFTDGKRIHLRKYKGVYKAHWDFFSPILSPIQHLRYDAPDWYVLQSTLGFSALVARARNHGRNPIMHARTINKQKYFTSKSAIDFLYEWMNRIK